MNLFSRRARLVVAVMIAFCLAGVGRCLAEDAKPFAKLDADYTKSVRPLLTRFCLGCHSTKKKVGELDLEQFTTLARVRKGTRSWLKVVEMLDNGEMPPKKSAQPDAAARETIRDWVERYLSAEALARAGDPGPVVLRRLNNAEYTYTIRDLIGVPLSPAKEFPTEGAAGEGFTNTGNALVMSPALLRKYLDAGQEVARHAMLVPDGIRFSAGDSRRDWTDQLLSEIRSLYGRFTVTVKLHSHYNLPRMSHLGNAGQVPLEPYFAATLVDRKALTTGQVSVAEVARRRGLNARYLQRLWSELNQKDQSSLLAELARRWQQAKPGQEKELAEWVKGWQRGLWVFNPVGLIGKKGSRPRWMEAALPLLVEQELKLPIPAPKPKKEAKKKTADKDEKADGKTPATITVSLVVTAAGDGNTNDFVLLQKPRLVLKDKPDILLKDLLKPAREPQPKLPEGHRVLDASHFGKHPDGKAIDAASICVQAPSVIRIELPVEAAGGRELVTTIRLDARTGAGGSVQVDLVSGIGQITAGLKASEVNVTYGKINIGADVRDVSFRNAVLVSESSPARSRFATAMTDHRSLFPAALCYTQIVPVDELLTLTLMYREDDHLVRLMLDPQQAARLETLWDQLIYVSREPLRHSDVLDSLLETTIDHPQQGIFDQMVKDVRKRTQRFRQRLKETEPQHLDAVIHLAERAWRRPLDFADRAALRGLYRKLRTLDLSHDAAIRMTLARVFVSSSFLYRLEESPVGETPSEVSGWELASRLSYFLWSTTPDDPLRQAAGSGQLSRRGPLLDQSRRLLSDPRVRRLATEFACQWIHVHDFDLNIKKSAKQFPEFTKLRGDMYEETIRFFADLFQHDRSLLELLDADHTFVNKRLGDFYGIPGLKGDGWRRVDGVRKYGRGGVLGLATTLATQSGATRTSPILRGNWISEVLLGERLPRPPKNVPQLADEVPVGLSERQLIERHSSDAACAKCHSRIDPFGFALEHYDAIGRRREKTAGGVAIDSKTTLPDGTKIDGLDGLRGYLLKQRREAFLRQFCRKLLGYALGRELQLSDRPLVDEMLKRLVGNNYRFSVAVETIVTSGQFRMIRGTPADRGKP